MSDGSDNEGKEIYDPEQEIKYIWIPKVSLPEIEIITGEENEDVLFKNRSKLYRWRESEWKERGTGELKILRDKLSKKIRVLMRQDKTKKIVCNFLVQDDPICQIKEHLSSDNSFFLIANDFSNEISIIEKFVFKFSTNKMASQFKLTFLESKQFIKAMKNGGELIYSPIVNDLELKINVLELRKDRSLSFSESGETKSSCSSNVSDKK